MMNVEHVKIGGKKGWGGEGGGGGAEAQSIGRAMGSILALGARSILVESESVKFDRLGQKSWPLPCLCLAEGKNVKCEILGPAGEIA